MNRTSIPWADYTWNPITGCTRGCDYCYARRIAERFRPRHKNGEPLLQPLDGTPVVTGSSGEAFPCGFSPTIYPDRLDEPLRLKKPSRIFLGSMGDLFDPAFSDEFRNHIFAIVAATPQHTYLLLTKQAEEMRRFIMTMDAAYRLDDGPGLTALLPNLWLGVTVTNQADADERTPLLLDTPAAHRFVSVEPMLGPVDLTLIHREVGSYTDALRGYTTGGEARGDHTHIDLVIAGAKTPGKPLHTWLSHRDLDKAYPGHVASNQPNYQPREWLRSLCDQCLASGVPLHYKWGRHNPALDGVIYDWRPPCGM